MQPGLHGTTFGGGPLACAVAIEFIEQLDGILGNVQRIGEYFRDQLERLAAKHSCICEVRGLGLMLGIELDSSEVAKTVVLQLLRSGIIINRTHETVLRFLPPYIIQNKHVDIVIRALDSALLATASKAPGANRRAFIHRSKV